MAKNWYVIDGENNTLWAGKEKDDEPRSTPAERRKRLDRSVQAVVELNARMSRESGSNR